MHPLTTDLAQQILALIRMEAYSLLGAIQDNKTVLGGSAGSGGGTGDPPAGFVGQLTQSNVTFDTAGSTRACSAGSAGSSSLVDNLDAIRLGIEICDDAIGDRHIDWGTGAGQVSAVDVPFQSSSGSISATDVREAIEEAWLHGGVTGGSVIGSGVANQVAYWTAANTIGGDAGFTYAAATDTITLTGGITLDGASAANIITVPDNLAQAMNLVDVGGLEYLRIVSTDANPYLCFFPGGGGKLGLGTLTVPHGGVGYAIYAIDGANSSADGPHMQFTTATDDYPLLQIFNWAHDEIGLLFDCYYDGAFRSSDPGSSFAIYKSAGKFHIFYDIAAAGGAVAWEDGIVLSAGTGNVAVGRGAALGKMHVDQSAAGGARPVLRLDQADLSEEFIEFAATVGAGNPIDTAAIGGYYGKVRVKVTGVAGYKYLALYN